MQSGAVVAAAVVTPLLLPALVAAPYSAVAAVAQVAVTLRFQLFSLAKLVGLATPILLALAVQWAVTVLLLLAAHQVLTATLLEAELAGAAAGLPSRRQLMVGPAVSAVSAAVVVAVAA
jgi:hypothetical protein